MISAYVGRVSLQMLPHSLLVFHPTVRSCVVRCRTQEETTLQSRSRQNLKPHSFMAQSVQRRATGWTARVRFPTVKDGSLLHSDQTGSEAPQPHIQWVPVALSPGVNRPGREDDRSPPASAEVMNGGAIPPLPLYVFKV
jgi:hypothetical protein